MKFGWIAAMLAMTVVGGCASPGKQDQTAASPQPPVAPAPKYVPEALKPELREKARRILLAETTASDPFLRCNALEALADVDSSDAGQPIMQALSDPEISVRFAAIMAAGQIKLVDAYQPLGEMADDPDQ